LFSAKLRAENLWKRSDNETQEKSGKDINRGKFSPIFPYFSVALRNGKRT